MKIETVEHYKVDGRIFHIFSQAEDYVKSKVSEDTVKSRNRKKIQAATGWYVPIGFKDTVDIIERCDDFIALFQDTELTYLDEEFTILTPDEFMMGFFENDFYVQSTHFEKIMNALLQIGTDAKVDWKKLMVAVANFEINSTFTY